MGIIAEIKAFTLDRCLIATSLVLFPVQSFELGSNSQINCNNLGACAVDSAMPRYKSFPTLGKTLDLSLFSLVLISIFCSLKILLTSAKAILVLPYYANNVRKFYVVFSENLTTFSPATIFKGMREFNFKYFLSLSAFLRN